MSYDDAWDYALDAGLCRDAAADYAYDVWRGAAPPPVQYPPASYREELIEHDEEPLPPQRVSGEWLEHEYGWRCRR